MLHWACWTAAAMAETQLTFDNSQRTLGIRVRETILTPGNGLVGNLSLKVQGQLNTRTGKLEYHGRLCKFVTGAARQRNLHAFKTKLRVGPMLKFDSNTDDIVGGLLLKKHQQLGSALDAWLKVGATVEMNTRTHKAEGTGHVRLSKSIYNFTERQDVRLSVGYRGVVDEQGNFKGDAYGQLRENNWSLNTDFQGYVGVRYDL